MTDQLLWIVPALPLLGFLVLALAGRGLGERAVAVIGTGTVALSAALAVALVAAGPAALDLWTWLRVEGLTARLGLRLDPLSSCFVLVITVVGALIHLFATEYMRGDPGYGRFFAYMNLFVAMMLVLVLADDLLALYLGWEGVGLCSWLLIGFWYDDARNSRAAQKAFVVTRIGDAAFAVGLFLLASRVGTLSLPDVLEGAAATFPAGGATALAAALLLLGGAVGKSAQVPLQVWLPDAMAGPTPVSALIHAATMVTAGVYLIARTHPLFLLAPTAMDAVAVLGTATLLVGGVSALFQRDLKRVLAYSTMSQIGYMFLALGVGAWTAAIFHFVTHALFKALLFLAAGAVILAMDHVQDMSAMGGLRRKVPATFATFLVGALGLAGVPLLSGFFSKEAILAGVAGRSTTLWVLAVLGAGITAVYTARMVILVFFGPADREIHHRPGPAAVVPMVALAVLSVLAGALGLPDWLGGFRPLDAWLATALPVEAHAAPMGELAMAAIVTAVVLAGLGLAWALYARPPAGLLALREQRAEDRIALFARDGLGFDDLYERLVVRPFVRAGIANRKDVIDWPYEAAAALAARCWAALSRTQDGRLRGYLVATTAGAVLLVGIALWA